MPKKPIDVDKMLSESEAGRGPKNLKEQNQMSQGLPKEGTLFTMPMGPRGGQIKPKDYAPKNISPHGDLGILDDKEQRAFFTNPIKGADAEWRSSKHFPMGKVRTMGDDEVWPRVDRNSPVYPQHDLKDYSGVKAGSMVGGHGKNQRGVVAKTKPVETSKAVGNFVKPIVNKKVKNV